MYINLLQRILKKIEPDINQRKKIYQIAKNYVEKTRNFCLEIHEVCDVVLVGSVEKDTMLKNNIDIDILVLFREDVDKIRFKELGLEIGKKVFDDKGYIERYVSHPYLEKNIDDIVVSIIPGYKVIPPEWKSAVDRTYYHIEYVKTKLSKKQNSEVRLLKSFLKNIKIYGAETHINGFSGYLSELLIIKYGTFLNTVKMVSNWKIQTIIDIENLWTGNVNLVKNMFLDSYLIVIDPVDKNRNVAASVNMKTLAKFISVCRAFLNKPSEKFFISKLKNQDIDIDKIFDDDRKFILLYIKHDFVIEDTLYPKIKKLSKKIENKFKSNNFRVIKTGIYLNIEKSYIFFELEQLNLSRNYMHIGPTVFEREHETQFIKKNFNLASSIWITADGKWATIKKRTILNACNILTSIIRDDPIFQKQFKTFMIKSSKIFEMRQILKLVKKDIDLHNFFIDFALGEELWLAYMKTK